MKTIREFFEEVPDETMKKRLLTNLNKKDETKVVSSLFEAINSGFGWAATDEGQDYWSRIYTLKDLGANSAQETIESRYLASKGNGLIREMVFIDQKNTSRKVAITLNGNPFNNCQNCAIASFDNLLTIFDKADFENIIGLFYKYGSNKKLMAFDVHGKYKDQINSTFAERVVFLTPYKSTNGSAMIMGLLNIEPKVKVA